MNITKDKISTLIIKIGFPSMVGMFFVTMFNITDTYFAGQIGDGNSSKALAGVAASFPIFMIINAVSTGLTSSSGSLIGQQLGADKTDNARKYLSTTINISIIVSVIIGIVVFLLGNQLFSLMSNDPDVVAYGTNYTKVLFAFLPIFVLSSVINQMMNVQGLTKVVRNSLIIGFFANVFLDWLFISVFKWGTAGLAFATVLVQLTQLIFVYYFFAQTKLGKDLLRSLKDIFQVFKDSKAIKIIKLAIPAGASVMIVGVGMVALNRYASDLAGPAGISAIGIGFRVEQIFLISLFGGVGPAIMAIASQNYGAGKIDRVRQLYRDSIVIGFIMLITGSFVIYFASEFFAKAFTNDTDVIRETANYLRIEAFTLPAYVLLFISTSLMSALQRPTLSLIFNVSRQLISPILLYPLMIAMFASITNKSGSIDNLWYSIMVNNWLHGIIVFFVTYKILKKLKPVKVTE